MKKFVCYLVLLCLISYVTADCLMYNDCITIDGFEKPCPATGPARPILENISNTTDREAVIDLIELRCPELLYDGNGNRLPDEEVVSCCDNNQLFKMSESLMLATSVLGRCPTCIRNFARQVCEMNCSPDQSRFVEVYTETAADGTEYVNEINYRMNEEFMMDAFSSCSGVVVPQTGAQAVSLMCGTAPVCDAQAWFSFTGNTAENPLAPVQVNFIRTTTYEDSMNARAIPCNETFGSDIPCSCIDCQQNCPVGNEPTIPEVCTVLSINCIAFSVGLVFLVVSLTIFAYLTFREIRQAQNVNFVSDTKEGKHNSFGQYFKDFFSNIGVYSASNPALIIMLVSWLVFGLYFGYSSLVVTSSPIEIWSEPTSKSRESLDYFNSRFGPFYRAAQVFLTIKDDPFVVDNVTYGPAFRIEAIQEMIKLENAIINIGREDGGITLEDVCYAPLRGPGEPNNLDLCVIMSPATYFGDNKDNLNNATYLNQIQNCLNNYMALSCLAPWGGGSEPELSFGGFDDNVLSANSLLINFPIANHLLSEDLVPVLEWEQKFLDLMVEYENNWKAEFVDVSYGCERSVEDEIKRVSKAEAIPIIISYLLMFLYVTLALGNARSLKSWLVESKVLVAIGSICVVIVSVFCALCIMGYTGISITLLAINVIPFFILSVGIDNVFLMVNTIHGIDNNLSSYDDYKESFTFVEKRAFVFSKMMSKVGPSMFVSSATQITCFGIGVLSGFPAVKTFSIFAAISLSILFCFQLTLIVSILSLDYKRSFQNRYDVLFCLQKKSADDEDVLHTKTPYESLTTRFMVPYSKFLLQSKVKIVVATVFMAALVASVMVIPRIEVGLDQNMALPADSYVYKYLESVNEILRLGPPVYFVLKTGLNFSDPIHQNVICGGQLCNEDSLTTQIFLASQYSNITYLSKSSNSWLDDFFDWASLPGSCCKYNATDGGFCESTNPAPECQDCSIPRSEFADGLRPAGSAFEEFIPSFLRDPPNELCNKGGLASYYNNVNYVLDSQGRATIGDTNFMAYHSPLSTSYDYIEAIRNAYEICDRIMEAIKENTGLDVEVFAHSVFYVYYEQYLTMWRDTLLSILYCICGVLFVNFITSGFNILTTFAVIVNAVIVVVTMMGVMYVWNIPLNAVSCVNLIVSIGLSVEFCSHIAYAFANSTSPPGERVTDALKCVGSTIITGITLTNIPIIVLAFSYTEIIEVFFFRMFFSIVIIGFLSGMVFFPVLLSYLDNLKRK